MATIIADNPYCFVIRPPDRTCSNLAVDAMQKGIAMVKAWEAGPSELPGKISWPSGKDDDIVREDCPAFTGYHSVNGKTHPLCSANDRRSDLFRNGGVFNKYGKTTCGRCSWHFNYS